MIGSAIIVVNVIADVTLALLILTGNIRGRLAAAAGLFGDSALGVGLRGDLGSPAGLSNAVC